MPDVENGFLRPNLGIGLLRDRKNSFRLYAMEESIHFVTKGMNVRSELTKNCRIEEAVHKYKKKDPVHTPARRWSVQTVIRRNRTLQFFAFAPGLDSNRQNVRTAVLYGGKQRYDVAAAKRTSSSWRCT